MIVKVLGKYGPFSTNGGSTSGYLLSSKNKNVLLDMGSGTISKALKTLNVNDLAFAFISHTHFDHISDFGVLQYSLNFLANKGGKKLRIYMAKVDSEIYNLIKSQSEFEVVDIEENVEYTDSGFTFSFYKMVHPVLSYGIKISDGERTLSYSGDTSYTENVYSLVKGANLAILDGAFLVKNHSPKSPHMSVLEVCEIAKKSGVKTIISHLSYNYTDEEVKEEVKKYNKDVIVAEEEKEYIV